MSAADRPAARPARRPAGRRGAGAGPGPGGASGGRAAAPPGPPPGARPAALANPGPRPAVLLIDEVPRGEAEFEAFLFEWLAESAVTIPELGTRRARFRPVVVLTSNRTRDLHDALKRRCLYHWIDYPDTSRVAEIIRRRVPAAGEVLAGQVARGVARLPDLDPAKPPPLAHATTSSRPLNLLPP